MVIALTIEYTELFAILTKKHLFKKKIKNTYFHLIIFYLEKKSRSEKQ